MRTSGRCNYTAAKPKPGDQYDHMESTDLGSLGQCTNEWNCNQTIVYKIEASQNGWKKKRGHS